MRQKKQSKPKKEKARVLIVSIIALLAIMVLFAVIAGGIVLRRNNPLLDAYANKDLAGIRDSVLFQSPDIHDRLFIGKEDAPLTIIIIIDFDSASAKDFYENKADWLKSTFADNGEARIYHKFILGRDEVDQKKGRYLYALASRCITAQSSGSDVDVIGFNKELLATKEVPMLLSEEELIALAGKSGADKPIFRQCLQQPSKDAFRELYIDMLESERFKILSPSIVIGVDGGNEETLFGDADEEFITKRMRFRQIRVGI